MQQLILGATPKELYRDRHFTNFQKWSMPSRLTLDITIFTISIAESQVTTSKRFSSASLYSKIHPLSQSKPASLVFTQTYGTHRKTKWSHSKVSALFPKFIKWCNFGIIVSVPLLGVRLCSANFMNFDLGFGVSKSRFKLSKFGYQSFTHAIPRQKLHLLFR